MSHQRTRIKCTMQNIARGSLTAPKCDPRSEKCLTAHQMERERAKAALEILTWAPAGLSETRRHDLRTSKGGMSPLTPHAHNLKGLYGVCGNERSGVLNTITAVERGAILCSIKRAQTEWVFAPDNAHTGYWHQAIAGSPTRYRNLPLQKNLRCEAESRA